MTGAELHLPAPEVWAEAARREAGRDPARDAAVRALDPALYERPLMATLQAAAGRWPGQVFVADAGQAVGFADLAACAAANARALRGCQAPAGPVAVLTRDTALAAAAMFACPAAGRISLALDPESPAQRNTAILRAAGVSLIAHGPEVAAEAVALADGCARLTLTSRGDARVPEQDAAAGLDPGAPAFIFATSGSTGAPKLVVRSQRSLAYLSAVRAVGLRHSDRIIASLGPPNSFSGALYLLAALFAGSAVHYADVRREGVRRYLERVAAEAITVLRITPSFARLVAALPGARAAVAGIRLVRFGGEPPMHEDVALLRAVLPADAVIDNGYSATEATPLHWTVRDDDRQDPLRVPAGFVDVGGEACILDAVGGICPPGAVGELVLRGRYIAEGEWVDGRCLPGRLVPDAVDPECRVYFTGDLARADGDGCIVVLGRVDRMLKINGQRVEPMEVENAIRDLADVTDVAVLPRVREQVTQLIAFIVPGARGQGEIAGALRERLRRHLPAHMLPARIIALDALPRLASGKVDGVALLARLD